MNDSDSFESYVRKVQADTRRYVHDLLAGNQKLRVAAATLQVEKGRLEEELLTLRQEVDRHRHQELRLERELTEIMAENHRFSDEYVSVEQQNSNLANLYVASTRLHSTIDREEVLSVIIDIIEFLVGCEQVAIFESDDVILRLAASKGIEAERFREISLGEGHIGRTALTGQPYVAVCPGADETGLTACIPLKLRDRVYGALALFHLLPQKSGRLEPIDHELLDLLAAQAGPVLCAASLLARVAQPAAPVGAS